MARRNLTVAIYDRARVMPNWCVFCHRFACEVWRGLEIEHLTPASRGGDNSFANLTMSCRSCNRKKGTKTLAEFGFISVPTFENPDTPVVRA